MNSDLRIESVLRDANGDGTAVYLELLKDHPGGCMCSLNFYDDGDVTLLLSNRQTGVIESTFVENMSDAFREATKFLEEAR